MLIKGGLANFGQRGTGSRIAFQLGLPAVTRKDLVKDIFRLLPSCVVEEWGTSLAVEHHAVNLVNTSYTSGG